jgi:hypothetical protein
LFYFAWGFAYNWFYHSGARKEAMAKQARKILKSVLKKSKKVLKKKSAPVRKRRSEKKISSPVSNPPHDVFLPATPPPSFSLPAGFGEDKAVLMVKDPWWLFAYWEVTPRRRQDVLEKVNIQGFEVEKTVLRVYDVTDTGVDCPSCFFDIELNFFADQWHIDAGKPDRQWMVEVGVRTRHGRFFAFVRSNVVRTPRFGMSDVLDEEWMMPEDLYRRFLGLSMSREGSWSLQSASSINLCLAGKP